jgi:hypothetical protein
VPEPHWHHAAPIAARVDPCTPQPAGLRVGLPGMTIERDRHTLTEITWPST